jgi:hypothetical protein
MLALIVVHPSTRSFSPLMWSPLDRARRRILNDSAASQRPVHVPPVGEPDPIVDVVLAIGRTELDRLIGALEDLVGTADGRPDTPARLEAALTEAITRCGGQGRPQVTRRPPGLYTPEAWQVRIDGADEMTRSALERALRGGGIA